MTENDDKLTARFIFLIYIHISSAVIVKNQYLIFGECIGDESDLTSSGAHTHSMTKSHP